MAVWERVGPVGAGQGGTRRGKVVWGVVGRGEALDVFGLDRDGLGLAWLRWDLFGRAGWDTENGVHGIGVCGVELDGRGTVGWVGAERAVDWLR